MIYEGKNLQILVDGEWLSIQQNPVGDQSVTAGWSLDEDTTWEITIELRWYDPLTDLWKAIENWLWSSWMGRN